MTIRFEETLGVIVHRRGEAVGLIDLAIHLQAALAAEGFEFKTLGVADHEDIHFIGDGTLLTMHRDPKRPCRLQISVETPIKAEEQEFLAARRLALMKRALRHISKQVPARAAKIRHLDDACDVVFQEPALAAHPSMTVFSEPIIGIEDLFASARQKLRERLERLSAGAPGSGATLNS